MSPNSDLEWFVASLALTALILFVEHWIPTGPHRYHRIFNYIMGTAAIFVGMTLYLTRTGRELTALEVWAFPIVGGLAVCGAYGWDKFMNLISRRAHGEANRTKD